MGIEVRYTPELQQKFGINLPIICPDAVYRGASYEESLIETYISKYEEFKQLETLKIEDRYNALINSKLKWVVEFKSFISTSRNIEVAKRFATNVIFEITFNISGGKNLGSFQGRNLGRYYGSSIEDISKYPEEQE